MSLCERCGLRERHRYPGGQVRTTCRPCDTALKRENQRLNWHSTLANHANKRGVRHVSGDTVLALWALQDAKCWYCGKDMMCSMSPGFVKLAHNSVSIDHVIPGVWEGNNVVLSCLDCNRKKGHAESGDFLNFHLGVEKFLKEKEYELEGYERQPTRSLQAEARKSGQILWA